MSKATITDDELASADTPARHRLHTRLVFVASTVESGMSSSVHALDELDEVRFRSGARAIERRGSTLVLAVPDSYMSSEHGRLKRCDARWVLDDPSSKNGSWVNGAKTKHALLEDGAVIELGRSIFYFRQSTVAAVPRHLTADVDRAGLPAWPDGMATFAPGLAEAFEVLVRLATNRVSLLLIGETGTGKEVIARAVHVLSRRAGDYVPVNCGEIPPMLISSELFGHRRGAFTHAQDDRQGLIRSAHRGTLFLDEVGELPLDVQPVLLRVLQEREVRALGGDRSVAVDIRVIAATLRALDTAGGEGRFRPDLYARLAGHIVVLPPLRERREDLGLIVANMLRRFAPGRAVRLSRHSWRALMRHDWPLNIRELENALSTALGLATGDVIEPAHLPVGIRNGRTVPVDTPAAPGPTPHSKRKLSEADAELRDKLAALLLAHEGNVVAVARVLGTQRSQIYKWRERFALDLSKFRRPR